MDELSMGDVAKRAGLQASALRYYEGIGLLPVPRRVNSQRRYQPDVLQRSAVIQFAKTAGFSIAEIQILLEGFDPATPPLGGWGTLARGNWFSLKRLFVELRP